MAPTLPRRITRYLAASANEEEEYNYATDDLVEGEDISSNDGDHHDEISEGHESSPGANRVQSGDLFTRKRSLFPLATLDGGNKTLTRRAKWADVGSKTNQYKDSMDTRFGGWHLPRPRPQPKVKTIFALGELDKNGKHIAERVTLAKCINDAPVTFSTCEINGRPGPEYVKELEESIGDLAQSHNRRDRELALESVIDHTAKIARSRCNMQLFCRRTVNRETNYLIRPEDDADPAFDVGWNSYASHGTLPDLRIPKKEMNGAKKAGKGFANSAQSLASLDCTIGNKTASEHVELTQAQLRGIDGDWYNSGPTLQQLNTSLYEAKTADCPGWKSQNDYFKAGTQAVDRAYSAENVPSQQSRYFFKKATDQMEGRKESFAAPSYAPASLAATAALEAAFLSYSGLV